MRTPLFVSVLVLASATASAAPTVLTTKAPSVKLKLFSAVYRSDDGLTGEVRINDMPVCSFNGKGNSGSSSEVQGFLKAGTNKVEIKIGKVPAAPDDHVAVVSLHGLATPGFPGDENELWKIVLGKSTKPGALLYTFDLPANQAPPSQLWTRAAVTTALTDADKKELRALATSMLDAIQKSDVAAAHRIWTFAMEERARSTYGDPKELVGQIDQMLPMMKEAFGKGTVAAKLDFALVAEGRVVVVTAPGGGPPITSGDPDSGAAMPLKAAKLDGKWTLVP